MRAETLTYAALLVFALPAHAGQVVTPPKDNIGAIVLVDSRSPNYRDFAEFIQLYVDHFDVPYVIWNVAERPLTPEAGNASLLIVGHNGVGVEPEEVLARAVEAGTGIVSFDSAAEGVVARRLARAMQSDKCEASTSPSGQPITIHSNAHFITRRKDTSQTVQFRGCIPMADYGRVSAGFQVLASIGAIPFLTAGHWGTGRAVVFSSYAWLDPEHLGFFAGLDDLVWRSLVWASRKPFVMQGMPPMVSFRIDDCSGGANRDWDYVKGIEQVGIVPHCTFFLDDVTGECARKMAQLVRQGRIEVSVHARTNERFFWWDHERERPFDDATMQKNYEDAARFFKKHGIKDAKSLNIHWEEMGWNSAQYMKKLGIEFVVSYTRFGMPIYRMNQLMALPYMKYRASGFWLTKPSVVSTGDFYFGPRAVMDWLDSDHAFFDNYVEPTDIKSSADWLRRCALPPYAGTFEDAGMVLDATAILRRELDSMFLAYYFTHEQNIRRYDTARFARMVRAVWDNLAGYQPEPVSYDRLNQYARAQFTSHLERATYNRAAREIVVRLSGRADLETRFWVYTGGGDEVSERMERAPRFTKSVEVRVAVP